MGRTSSITMPSMAGIVGCAPAVDQKVWCFLFFYLSRFRMTKFAITEMLLRTVIVKTIIVSLHRGRFVVVHLYWSFPTDPQNFPRSANFYPKLPFLAIFGTVRPHVWSYNGHIWRGGVVLGRPPPGKILYKSNKGIYPFWEKFIPKITIFGDF